MSITGGPRKVHITRWGAIPWQPFEALVGVLLLSGCIGIITKPPMPPYGHPPALTVVMAVVYAVGGLGILVGLWRMWDRVELLGLLCLVLVGALRVLDSALYETGDPSRRTIILMAAMAAAAIRARQIATGRALVQLDGPPA